MSRGHSSKGEVVPVLCVEIEPWRYAANLGVQSVTEATRAAGYAVLQRVNGYSREINKANNDLTKVIDQIYNYKRGGRIDNRQLEYLINLEMEDFKRLVALQEAKKQDKSHYTSVKQARLLPITGGNATNAQQPNQYQQPQQHWQNQQHMHPQQGYQNYAPSAPPFHQLPAQNHGWMHPPQPHPSQAWGHPPHPTGWPHAPPPAGAPPPPMTSTPTLKRAKSVGH